MTKRLGTGTYPMLALHFSTRGRREIYLNKYNNSVKRNHHVHQESVEKENNNHTKHGQNARERKIPDVGPAF
jgi:hypothetical protein